MEQLAFGLDAKFQKRDDYGQRNLLKDFSLFRQGHSRKIYNLITKTDSEKEMNIFDYHYVIQAGNTPVPVRQTVFFVNSKMLALPQFFMQPETFFHKIGQYLGMQDIDFEQFPKFSHQ